MLLKAPNHPYGRKQGGGRGQVIAPEWVAVSSFGRRRSLSDLAVWGFPEIFPENLPPQALLSSLLTPFLPLDYFLQFFHPQTPSFNSLTQAVISPCYLPYPLFPPLTLLSPYRTLSEHLRNPSIGSLKGPKMPFLGLFRSLP